MGVETLAGTDNPSASSDPAPRENYVQVEGEASTEESVTVSSNDKPQIRLNRGLRRQLGIKNGIKIWGDPSKPMAFHMVYPDRRSRMTKVIKSKPLGPLSPKEMRALRKQAKEELARRAQFDYVEETGVSYG